MANVLYESLTCHRCGAVFVGRRPAECNDLLCPECLKADELPVLTDDEDVPEEADEFCGGGKGDEDEDED